MSLAAIDHLLLQTDRAYRRRLVFCLLLAAGQTLLVVLRPLPLQLLLPPDPVPAWIAQAHALLPNLSSLALFLLFIAALEFSVFGVRVTEENASTRLSERLIRRLRARIARHLLRGPAQEIADLGVGRIVAAATGDVETVQRLIKDVVIGATLALVQLVLMIGVLTLLHPPLGLVLLVEILLLSALIALYARWRKLAFLAQMKNQENFLTWITGLQQRSLDLRFGVARGWFFRRTLAFIRAMNRRGLLLWHRQTLYFAAIDLFVALASAACLVMLFLESESEPKTLATVLIFLYYAALVFPCLAKIGEAAPLLIDGRNAYERLSLTLGTETAPNPHPPAPPRFETLTLENLGLQDAEGKWLMRNVSLTIRAGEQVALFGESGSGKSTLFALLLGVQTPTEGRILLDGRPLGTLSLADRKRLFMLHRSNGVFFPGTVAENIALGRDLTEAHWEELLTACGLAGRIAAAPQGLATRMGARGEPFSQGEGQRLALARALLSDAPILLLDEALNSLDEPSEHAVTAGLRKIWRGQTLLLISHRRSVSDSFSRRIEIRKGHGLIDHSEETP
jgi:ABC-type multidrug transport system fused ATPase/permease subunit